MNSNDSGKKLGAASAAERGSTQSANACSGRSSGGNAFSGNAMDSNNAAISGNATPSGNTAASGTETPVPTKCVQAQAGRAALSHPVLRAVFMGTPGFAATILEQLIECPHVEIVGVYSQPDRPAGRGKKLTPPPVKEVALAHGLPIFQPLHFKNDAEGTAATEQLASLAPDVLLVAAYGLILPERVLAIPKLLPINVHASLLPKYRGAAPIQRAIMNADAVTGTTIMRMEKGLDTGPMLMQRAVGIDINDTSESLHDELAHDGADLLIQALERLRAGALAAIPQDDARATYAAKLSKEESLIDFSLGTSALHAVIRGLTPWPGASLQLQRAGQEPLSVLAKPGCYPLSQSMKEKAAAFWAAARASGEGEQSFGKIIGVDAGALLVSCAQEGENGTDGGAYAFTVLRPAGKKDMDGKAFANGYLTGAEEACFALPHKD